MIKLFREVNVNMHGRPCLKCENGIYGERSIYDDWDCKVTCDKCRDRVESYRKISVDISSEV